MHIDEKHTRALECVEMLRLAGTIWFLTREPFPYVTEQVVTLGNVLVVEVSVFGIGRRFCDEEQTNLRRAVLCRRRMALREGHRDNVLSVRFGRA